MKRKAEIIQALEGCEMAIQDMKLFDGEPELYINQGWQEALRWIITKTTHRRFEKWEKLKK